MTAVDTNVLLYARDPRDPRKRDIAIGIISSLEEPVLLWQVACEYLSASRKLESFGFGQQDAWADLQALRTYWYWTVPDWSALERCHSIMKKHSLSFWDGVLIAACLESGVSLLLSEDLSGYTHIEGLRFENPFAV